MKRILLILIALTSFILTNCGQTKKANEISTKIDNYLFELEGVGLNGSVLVFINGEPIISKGYGFANIENQIANSPATIFDIGSITKQFTATAILKLEMQEKLSTENTLSKYFDNVPKDKENITIHDLLRHQSGLISNVGNDYEKISEEDFLKEVFSSKLKFEVGKGFSYSNVGYSVTNQFAN